ncbi:uncharacterized protein PADG_02718 [Paracoccidioides brasiliensis Pb18]|uniref:Oxidoreductase n=1 Tax=Paracoccidioides brasiliensis (strain Pb18) TaxID=502780 RepID=C1G6B3_PARBD|nr:uncharacterized protein PADG_02718 [Paracoccidioides brasiliensis Pb18]EEH46620.2 hypothetical protein PADG_02718 [Paracoccidioides brasiliensis Pb18]
MTSHSKFGAQTTATEVTKAFSDQIKGLTVLITGANPNGIGGSTAMTIAQHAPACIIITGRTQEKLDAMVKDLNTSFPEVQVVPAIVDLSSQRSVREAAAEISKAVEAIDVVINNAGVMAIPEREISEDGFEMHLATNHIGNFLLTNLLMDKIRLAAIKRPGVTRIVNVSSVGFDLSAFRFQDYNFDGHPVGEDEVGLPGPLVAYSLPTERVDHYMSLIAYGQSKTANVLFITYLAKHLAGYGISSFVIHPGAIQTELGRHLTPTTLAEIASAIPGWKTRDQGAATSVVAAFDPALKGTHSWIHGLIDSLPLKFEEEERFVIRRAIDHSGAYLIDCQISSAPAYATDPEKAEKLWKLTESFVGQEFRL